MIPYARFLQAARVASESAADSQKARMIESAFVGWQVAGSFGGGKEFPTFEKYLSGLGLAPKGSKGVSNAARDREKLAALERLLPSKT